MSFEARVAQQRMQREHAAAFNYANTARSLAGRSQALVEQSPYFQEAVTSYDGNRPMDRAWKQWQAELDDTNARLDAVISGTMTHEQAFGQSTDEVDRQQRYRFDSQAVVNGAQNLLAVSQEG